jgi:hypothetical protein
MREPLFTYIEFATTDDSGRFAIDEHLSRSANMWIWKTHLRGNLSVHHSSYGYESSTLDVLEEGGEKLIRLSLVKSTAAVDSALEQCRTWPDSPRAVHICPFDPDLPYPDGQPRHAGSYTNDHRRQGEWTFYYEDGSVAARGHYSASIVVGRWEFFDRTGRRTSCTVRRARAYPWIPAPAGTVEKIEPCVD